MMFLGIGAIVGALTSGIMSALGKPIWGFGIVTIFALIVTIAGVCTGDELETNKFASVKDQCLIEWEE